MGISVYSTGTVALTNGSAAAVFTGALLTLGASNGDFLYTAEDGYTKGWEITITDDTHATLNRAWSGATGSYAYEIRRLSVDNKGPSATLRSVQALVAGLGALLSVTAADQTIALNKASATDNAGITFKDNSVSVGRVGAFGNDNVALQWLNVATWTNALSMDKATGAVTISGHPTIEGVTATGATGTGKVVFSIAPTFTGTLTAAAATLTGTLTATALAASGAISTSDTTPSTSFTTGSGKFGGGVGITGALWLGGDFNINKNTPSITLRGTEGSGVNFSLYETAGQFRIGQTGVSDLFTLTTAGAATFSGIITGSVNTSVGLGGSYQLLAQNASGTTGRAGIGIVQTGGGGGFTIQQDITGTGIIQNSGTNDFIGFYDKGGHNYLALSGGAAMANTRVTINSTQTATSTTTGALVVAGGAGFGGTIYAAALNLGAGGITCGAMAVSSIITVSRNDPNCVMTFTGTGGTGGKSWWIGTTRSGSGVANGSPGNFIIFNQSDTITGLTITSAGVVMPGTNNTQDLGSSSVRWATIYAQNALNTSDARAKANLTVKAGVLDRAMKLPVYDYDYYDSANLIDGVLSRGASCRRAFGVVAQEARELFPEMVFGDAERELLSITESKVGVIALAGLQEHVRDTDVRIAALTAELAAANARIDQLEAR
jgi:hypothetical protein